MPDPIETSEAAEALDRDDRSTAELLIGGAIPSECDSVRCASSASRTRYFIIPT